MPDQRSARPARQVPEDSLAASLNRLEDLQDRRELRLDLPSGENFNQ